MPGPVARLGNWFSHVLRDGARPLVSTRPVVGFEEIRPISSEPPRPTRHTFPTWSPPSGVPTSLFTESRSDLASYTRHSRSKNSHDQHYESAEKSERQSRLFLYLCCAAPAVFFRSNSLSSSDDDSPPFGTSPTSPSLSPNLESQPNPKRIRFTGTGGLMLGLGTLGVLSHKADSKPSGVEYPLKGVPYPFRFRVPASVEEQLPIKQKLFQNLQDMFHLSPDVTDRSQSESQSQTTSSCSSSVPQDDDSSSSKPIFERLVQGDKLVLTEGDITKDQWKALSAFLTSCPHITSLRLQGMEISSADADELGPGLKQLRHITFCDNSIGLTEGTLERVVALLLCCGLLESTSIVRNSLGDQHVPELTKLLKHNNLTHISLCWNGIADTGASQIASAVAILNTCLRDVDLSYNLVGPEGKAKLLEASRRRIAQFGTALKVPLNIHLRHNDHAKNINFKHDFTPFHQPQPPNISPRNHSILVSLNLKHRMNALFNKENFYWHR